jgi:uncharacterized membrane protein HdeD (DUF308 family)
VVDLNSDPKLPTTTPPLITKKRRASKYFVMGFIFALLSLFVIPEVFGSVAIILGAYTWRLDCGEKKSRGLLLVIFGIISMLIGIYYTSYLGVYNILPP